MLWGLAITVGVYQSVPHLPVYREEARRYLCSHPIEYAEVGLFIIGMCMLCSRAWQLRRELLSLKLSPLGRLNRASHLTSDKDQKTELLSQEVAAFEQSCGQTLLSERLREASQYLRLQRSTAGFEAHLKYLAEMAAERLAESYSLLLTINWAVPILGFLGTVVGITLAIANVTPEQLDTSLNSVTGGLAVAFDTTSVAMTFSLVLVFAYDWVKRAETRLLGRIDEHCITHLLPLFPQEAPDREPLLHAQAEASQQLLTRTEALIADQNSLWQESLDQLRARWAETLSDQQSQLSAQLTEGVSGTLTDHAQLLDEVRGEFLAAFREAGAQFTRAVAEDAAERARQSAESAAHGEQLWTQFASSLQGVVDAHDARSRQLLDSFGEKLTQWQNVLAHSAGVAERQQQALQTVAAQWSRLADQQEPLARLQEQLNANLDALRTAETFEQTLHNLTAAVHLLTARARPKAA
jgi:biopolymer transport protein ExbB/TolQ